MGLGMGDLPYDWSRCRGVGGEEDGVMHWREGCEDCLRRTSPWGPRQPVIQPPAIIAFECEHRVGPEDWHGG